MILADKIIENRKKNGWSQEELAEKLGVSRQSISKWEGAQSIPDMKKIIQLSEIFGVSTDYLIKDEIEFAPQELKADPYADSVSNEESARIITMEEASAFLEHNDWAANRISLGVMLCILSPVVLLALGGFYNMDMLTISDKIAATIGMLFLFCFVGVAITFFILAGLRGKPYEFLEKDAIDTAYGVSGMAKERKAAYAPVYIRNLVVGIMLCFLAALPIMIFGIFEDNNPMSLSGGKLEAIFTATLLIVVSLGVKLIVKASILKDGNDKLLEEGDFTRIDKRASRYDGIYWALATAAYFTWSFITFQWQFTWILWPIAGIIYAAYHEIMKGIMK